MSYFFWDRGRCGVSSCYWVWVAPVCDNHEGRVRFEADSAMVANVGVATTVIYRDSVLCESERVFTSLVPKLSSPLCFIGVIILYLRLNVGGGDPGHGRLSESTACIALPHACTERLISIHTWLKPPRLSLSDVHGSNVNNHAYKTKWRGSLERD